MVAREKELRNFFGNVVSTLRETDAVVAQRASSPSDSSHRWHSTRWQVTRVPADARLWSPVLPLRGFAEPLRAAYSARPHGRAMPLHKAPVLQI